MDGQRGSRVISVSGLFVYPVKSCGGVAVDEALVGATGLDLDRRWMVIGEDGVFLSQRAYPHLALVRVRIGDVDFRVVKPCARCVITTTNQETGDRSSEPLRTLATYRVRESQVLFGQNLIHGGRGSMRVGDPVVVLSNKT